MMTHLETRGERLAKNTARAYKAAHWFANDPNPTYSRLDMLDGLPRTGPDMNREEVPTLPEPPMVTRADIIAWASTAAIVVVVLGLLSVVEIVAGAR